MGLGKEAIIRKIEGSGRNSVGHRKYEQRLRLEIVEYLEQEVRKGGHFEHLCSELGVDQSLPRRWKRNRKQGGFGAVKVVKSGSREEAPQIQKAGLQGSDEATKTLEKSALTLRSPSGWTITGLDVAALMALLPRLS